ASDDEIARMAALVAEGLRAGAVGFSTSRTKLHLAADGSAVAGSFADERELHGIAGALRDTGRGVFQMVSDFQEPGAEFAWLRRLALQTRVPAHYVLVQYPETPGKWRTLLQLTEAAVREGAALSALVGCRPVGMVINLDSRHHPFSEHLSYRRIAALPLAERLQKMREPAFRAQLLAESPSGGNPWWRERMAQFENLYRLGDPPDYEPEPERSIAAIAAREAREPEEVVYDYLVAGDGGDWLYFPLFNYADASFEPLLAMLQHPNSLLSLADGGAHCGLICDASAPTYLLTHWVRDRERGPRLPLAQAVALQTGRTAAAYGLHDRGRLVAGLRADLNVIDFDNLKLDVPSWVHDLPANGRRLMQKARGYDATICAGQVTWRHGEATGALPGRVIRH
ncbi:MAG: amidohydrolase family protein, partial [Solimonas sp.]